MGIENAVEMFVGGLVLDPNTQAPVVVLKDERGDICLPIWIGVAEATSIASAIKQVNMARPLTHDLMFDVLSELEVKVERILITELRDSTYFAELVLTIGDKVLVFDSRPSDAIGIALRASAPIFVSQTVLEQAKIAFPTGSEEPSAGGGSQEEPETDEPRTDFNEVNKDKWTEILDELDPEDFKYKM
jgi:uncharacterized protein